MEDIEIIYNDIRSLTNRKRDDYTALKSIKRIMRAKNNVSNIDDFQMGLESGQPINHAQPLFSIISKPFGIVCQNEERKRLLLWFDELKKILQWYFEASKKKVE